MKTYRKFLLASTLSIIFGVISNLALYAQEQASNNKENKKVVNVSNSNSKEIDPERKKLNEDIEKAIENEKFLEKEHREMHNDDTPAKTGANHQFTHENKYLKAGYGQIESEKAQKTLQIANTNLEHAEAALLRAEEKIAQAKQDLLSAQKNNELKEEEIKERQQKIKKAESILNEAKEKFNNDLRTINSEFQKGKD